MNETPLTEDDVDDYAVCSEARRERENAQSAQRCGIDHETHCCREHGHHAQLHRGCILR